MFLIGFCSVFYDWRGIGSWCNLIQMKIKRRSAEDCGEKAFCRPLLDGLKSAQLKNLVQWSSCILNHLKVTSSKEKSHRRWRWAISVVHMQRKHFSHVRKHTFIEMRDYIVGQIDNLHKRFPCQKIFQKGRRLCKKNLLQQEKHRRLIYPGCAFKNLTLPWVWNGL